MAYREAMTDVHGDICDDVAAILHPLDAEERDAADEAVGAERREHAERLRLVWQEVGDDPVLAELRAARLRKLRAEEDIRLLIAYGREFVRPRPYKLIELAEAAGLSMSGVRIAYDDEEVARVARSTSRSAPARRPVREG
jgi:hypothetical protein